MDFRDGRESRAHEDGLTPPANSFDAVAALIFLLLASSSKRLLSEGEDDDPENIEAA